MTFELLAILAAIAYVVAIFLIVRSLFGPQYVTCDCGNRCRVSNDGWFYWKCDACGRSGKANPFN
jgi:hypothetical protein